MTASCSGRFDLDFSSSHETSPRVAVADLDGDKQPEVLVSEQPAAGEPKAFVLKVARRPRRYGPLGVERPRLGKSEETGVWPATLSRISATDGRRTVCLSITDPQGPHRVIVLDEQGRERASRELPQSADNVTAADINGDGRDELLVHYGDALHVWTRDLKELWSRPMKGTTTEQVLLASSGQAAAVIVPLRDWPRRIGRASPLGGRPLAERLAGCFHDQSARSGRFVAFAAFPHDWPRRDHLPIGPADHPERYRTRQPRVCR